MLAKKYYWLKLKEDFFRQKEIKKLRKIAGGDTYVIIYLKLQLLSIKNEGRILYEGIEENFAKELALELDEDPENVHMTLLFLEKYQLIEYTEISDEYILPAVLSCIGKESDSTERVRKHRDKQRALQCNALVTNCNTEKEKEIEIEQQQELEPEPEPENNNVVVEIFANYNIDVNPVLQRYPMLFSAIKKEDVNKIAMTLRNRKNEGRITNPVGLLLKNPEKTIKAILKGEFYPLVKKENNRSKSASYTPEYETYVPPD